MPLKSIIHATLALAAAGALCGPAVAQNLPTAPSRSGGATSDEQFVVGDIRIEGLQRISEGTVYNYLPINIGDRLDQRRVSEALRALYDTKFFRDVEMRREGGTLIIAVLERPSIESFEIKGNKDIKTEDLQKSLRNVGPCDRQDLRPVGARRGQAVPHRPVFLARQVRRARRRQGRGSARQQGQADHRRQRGQARPHPPDQRRRQHRLPGRRAAGAVRAEDAELAVVVSSSDDRYAREALSGDLEKLRSYYMDRGYANFAVTSTQVAIAPEKDDIFITINVNEGEVFKVSEVKIAGNMVVPESELRRLIFMRAGNTYSLRAVTATTEAMKLRLGVDGYAFATIDPVPQVNQETKEITLTFVVDPKNRVYVRRVNFNGTSGVNDEVFRREMRQLEGAYLSNSAVERSKQRIQRLPFIEKVEVETNQVAGAADLVDVDFQIEEGLPGQFGGGVGYSESQSIILNGNFVHSNFMGIGQPHRGRDQLRPLRQGVQLLAHRSLHDDRRSAALDLGRLSRRHAVHLGGLGLRHRDDQPRHQLRLADQRVPVPRHRRHCAALRAGHHRRRQRRPGGRLGAQQRQSAHQLSPGRRSTTTATIRSSSRS